MCVRVVHGKGVKDRYVPLAEDLRDALSGYWRIARPRLWLFPAQTDTAQPLDVKTAQRWYRRARAVAHPCPSADGLRGAGQRRRLDRAQTR
jgi:integrase